MRPTENKPIKRLALLLLSALLASCATRSPDSTPVQPPLAPKLPPTLAKPVSLESFLDRAQKDIEQWRKKLTESETK